MTDKKKQGGPAYAPLPPRYYIFGPYDAWDKAQMLKYADDTHELRMRNLQAEPEAAPQQATSPTADVVEKMISNTWDHFGDILPTLKAISRGEWYWGANQRCKYIEIRIDTRDGGCLLFDSQRLRISPEQFAHQSYQVGKMDPWPHRNALGDTAPQPSPTAQADSVLEDAGGANWQDISTAPKDGTRFVATGHNYWLYSEVRHICIAQWFRGCWMEASDWNETSELKYLTHWMPLPPLPGNAARKQGGA